MPEQDVIAWSRGPLPQALEQIAVKIFTLKYALADWADPAMSVERNACRRLALEIRVDVLKMGVTVETAAAVVAAQMTPLLFGNRRIGKTIREEIHDYCDSFVADFWGHFGRRLFYPRDIDANRIEVEAEDANVRRH